MSFQRYRSSFVDTLYARLHGTVSQTWGSAPEITFLAQQLYKYKRESKKAYKKTHAGDEHTQCLPRSSQGRTPNRALYIGATHANAPHTVRYGFIICIPIRSSTLGRVDSLPTSDRCLILNSICRCVACSGAAVVSMSGCARAFTIPRA